MAMASRGGAFFGTQLASRGRHVCLPGYLFLILPVTVCSVVAISYLMGIETLMNFTKP